MSARGHAGHAGRKRGEEIGSEGIKEAETGITGASRSKESRDGALIPTPLRSLGGHLGETLPTQSNVKKPTLFLHNGQPKDASQGSSRREDPIKGGREASAAHTELHGNAMVKGRVLSSFSNTLATKARILVVPHASLRVKEFAQCQ